MRYYIHVMRIKLMSVYKLIIFSALSCLFLLLTSKLYAEDTSSRSLDNPILSACELQKVSRVIDGDTFKLSDGTVVRLIGVDTPEVVDPRKEVQWFGVQSSNKMKEWIDGRTVCLRGDINKTQDIDKYGRLLRYVWVLNNSRQIPGEQVQSDGLFVNEELIKQGYASAYTKYPFQYMKSFRDHEKNAAKNNLGLWDKERQEAWSRERERNRAIAKTCVRKDVICPEDALNYIGKYKTVRFFATKSHDSGKAVFLNSKNDYKDHDNFTAVIFDSARHRFPPQAPVFYMGRTVDVTGKIKEYNGRAEIILKKQSQIRIVTSDEGRVTSDEGRLTIHSSPLTVFKSMSLSASGVAIEL